VIDFDHPLATDIIQYKAGGGGGASSTGGAVREYITYGNAELGLTGWTRYANTTPGVAPDDFGGTPHANVTWAINATDPMSGDNDYLLTKDAVNRQGEGVYFEFTLDKQDLKSIIKKAVRFLDSANFADNDISTYLMSSSDGFVSDSVREHSSFDELKAGTGRNTSYAQTGPSNRTYRFCIHIASTNATAYTVNFDSISVSPAEYSSLSNSPVYAIYSTSVAQSLVYQTRSIIDYGTEEEDSHGLVTTGAGWKFTADRDGLYFVNARIEIVAVAGRMVEDRAMYLELHKNGSSFSKLSDYEMKCTPTNAQTLSLNGGRLIYLNKGDYIDVEQWHNFTTGVALDGNATNNDISVFLVSGGDSGGGGRVIAVELRGDAATAQPVTSGAWNKVTGLDAINQEGEGWDEVNNKYIVPENGWYETKFTAALNSDADNDLISFSSAIYIDGSLAISKLAGDGINNSKYLGNSISHLFYLTKGQEIEFYNYQDNTDADSINLINDVSNLFASIDKRSGGGGGGIPLDKVMAKYRSSSGQTVATNSATVINYATKVWDTHNAVTIGAGWNFKAPKTGYYAVEHSYRWQAATWNSNELSWTEVRIDSVIEDRIGFRLHANGVVAHEGIDAGTVVYLLKDQTLDLLAYQNSGSNKSMETTGYHNFVTITEQ